MRGVFARQPRITLDERIERAVAAGLERQGTHVKVTNGVLDRRIEVATRSALAALGLDHELTHDPGERADVDPVGDEQFVPVHAVGVESGRGSVDHAVEQTPRFSDVHEFSSCRDEHGCSRVRRRMQARARLLLATVEEAADNPRFATSGAGLSVRVAAVLRAAAARFDGRA